MQALVNQSQPFLKDIFMKYYIGTLAFESAQSLTGVEREMVRITAANPMQAMAELKTHQAARLRETGHAVLPLPLEEPQQISPASYQDLAGVIPAIGPEDAGALNSESDMHDRVRTLATRLGNELKKRGKPVAHGTLLHAVAAAVGAADWFVLEAQPRCGFHLAKSKVKACDAREIPFRTRMHAVWLAEGSPALAAAMLNTSEDSLLSSMDAGEADSAFCGRPDNWLPQDSFCTDDEVMAYRHRIKVTVESRQMRDGQFLHEVEGFCDGRSVVSLSNRVAGEWAVGASSCLPSRHITDAHAQLACFRLAMEKAMELRDEDNRRNPPKLTVTVTLAEGGSEALAAAMLNPKH